MTLDVTSTDGTAAVAGDEVTILENDSTFHTYTITLSDIENGYADVILPELSRTGDFTLNVYVTDQSDKRSSESRTVEFFHQTLVEGTTGADTVIADESHQTFQMGQGNDTLYLSEFRNVNDDAFTIALVNESDGTQTYGIYVKESHVDQTEAGLKSMDFTLSFDTNALSYVADSGTKDSSITSMSINDSNAAESGEVTFAGFATPTAFTDYESALVTFEVTPNDHRCTHRVYPEWHIPGQRE